MRISQRTMYMNNINNMQGNLSAYMDANMKGASQKNVNKPSDDPAGAARILMYRSSISDLSQYKRNLDTADGWLSVTDQILTLGDSGVTSLLTKIKSLAEQGATGSQTPENRWQIGQQVREMFGSLMNFANTRYEDKSIFCGQDYNNTAFQMGLAADCYDADYKADMEAALQANPPDWTRFSGTLKDTALVRFPTGGTAGAGNIDYEYTTDGGKTWKTGVMTAADREINLDGVIMTVPNNVRLPAHDENNTTNTQLWVRPTAVYQGSDNNMPTQVVRKGLANTIDVSTAGVFPADVQIRIDTNIADWSVPTNFNYSYSIDGGRSWVSNTGNTADGRLVVPGGFVELTDTGATAVNAGTELTVKSQRTSLTMQGERDYFAQANNVGKDVFGGQYMSMDANGNPVMLTAFGDGPENVFETVGKLIGYLETNNQDGVQESLESLDAAMKNITNYSARIGGRKNALEVVKETLITSKDAQTDAMSSIEDIDLTELLTKLTQLQLAYSTVLKSSSMIMQLNLTQYI